MQKRLVGIGLFLAVFALGALPGVAASDTATPQPLVASYESLADVILGAKQAEWNLVHSILASTYSHAEGVYRAASGKIAAGKDAKAEIENLATLVGQLGTEGDAAVAAVRKRLIDGGHHHHADDGETGEYDEGFVIVTRKAKKAFLDAAKNVGRLAAKPDAAALEAAWASVASEFKALHASH